MRFGFIFLALLWFPAGQNRAPDVSRLEKRVFERINAERSRRQLSALKLDAKLSALARVHSTDMAKHGYLAHVNQAGQTPSDRGREAGYTCRRTVGSRIYTGIAENIFQNNLYNRRLTRGAQIVYEWNNEEKIASSTVDGWMRSEGHRFNILNNRYTSTGIGIAISPDYKVYITQEFC